MRGSRFVLTDVRIPGEERGQSYEDLTVCQIERKTQLTKSARYQKFLSMLRIATLSITI